MSCKFISELRRLSNLSAEAVQNIDCFDYLKQYMHVTRNTEIDFKKLMLKISNVDHKQLVLVCGSAGDGKSHLLSHLKYMDGEHILDSYQIINDATESSAPDQTAIETLSKRIAPFRDDRINDGGKEKVVLAINLGMLNNFIDSEIGKQFSKLKQYVINNNIFTVAQALPFNRNSIFQHINFSDYQLYTLTANGPQSDYLTALFDKIFNKSSLNPFYETYSHRREECPHHTQCPVRHNFEFLMSANVRNLLIQRIIEVCIKQKMVITSRDVLNFVFDAIVSPDFDEKEFWKILNNPAKFLKTYISCTTPMLVFSNNGTSKILDCMSENAANSEDIENRDADVLNFYAADDITPIVSSVLGTSRYGEIVTACGVKTVDNNRDNLKKYIYTFLMDYRKLTRSEALEDDKVYTSFVNDLYNAYAGNKKNLKNLYSAVKQSIYSWDGIYGNDLICIDDSSDEYNILEQLTIKYDVVQGSDKPEIFQFAPSITVRFKNEAETDQVSFSIDYALYKIIMAIRNGYCPTSQDRNIHADFASGIKALSKFGNKKSRVYIVPKRKKGNTQFLFEESDLWYSFKEV